MSAKISKKDQAPNQVDKDREALAAMAVESPHFKPGTYVLVNNRRAEVLETTGIFGVNGLLVAWENGHVERIVPMALNRIK